MEELQSCEANVTKENIGKHEHLTLSNAICFYHQLLQEDSNGVSETWKKKKTDNDNSVIEKKTI